MEEDFDWYDEEMEELAKAMLAAKEAYDEHLNKQGLDGAYYKLELIGYVLTVDFDEWKEISMKEIVGDLDE